MNKKGFTLIELLVVIGILGILMGVVVVAVNPARQFAQARNAARWSGVNTILNAIGQYYVDNGELPGDIGTTAGEICQSGVTETACGTMVFLDTGVLTPTYITALPLGPQASTTNPAAGTGYTVVKDTSDRVTVHALGKELDGVPNIAVTR